MALQSCLGWLEVNSASCSGRLRKASLQQLNSRCTIPSLTFHCQPDSVVAFSQNQRSLSPECATGFDLVDQTMTGGPW